MRRTSKTIGLMGTIMVLAGLCMAWVGALISRDQSSSAMAILFGSSLIYIMGGMLAVSHYNYQRGSPIYLLIMLGRLAFAAAAVITLVRAAGG